MALPLVLLVVALCGMALFLKHDLKAYRRFKELTDTHARQRQFRVWIVTAFVLFVGYTLLSLTLLGRLGTLAGMPAEFAPASAALGGAAFSGNIGGLLTGMAIGGAIAVVAGIVIGRRKAKRPPKTLGDFEALLPRNRAELVYAALLSINAGLTEELLFRLTLPLLFVLVVGNVWVAFALATIVFGLAHLYQGAVGVIATAVIGLVLALVYLGTGNLWVAVLLHAAIDLVGLVLRPLLGGMIADTEPQA